jgi:hypothetical protein
MSRRLTLLPAVALAAFASATCERVPLTAPGGSSIFAQANPPFVIANGGTSVVTALLTEPAGTLVPNGTEVYFFTNLGRIDSVVKTRNGVASANFVSDARSGTATITVWSGGSAPAGGGSTSTSSTTTPPAAATGTGTATVTIAIGSALPTRVVVTANPQRITSSRRATITANVFDNVGNPVQNVPVVFAITAVSPTTVGIEETLDDGGSPQYSDSNGQAFDTLNTRAAVGGVQKAVTVTATTANGIQGTVVVFVN